MSTTIRVVCFHGKRFPAGLVEWLCIGNFCYSSAIELGLYLLTLFHQADSVRYVLLPHYFTKLAGHHVHLFLLN